MNATAPQPAPAPAQDPAPTPAELRAPAHWRTVDFISDLHLKPEEPLTFHAWRHYLLHTPAQAIFILGDLFEAWPGDDCALPGSFEADCADVLRAASQRAALLFMHGNRDFLLGHRLLGACGVQLLQDPTVLHLGDTRYLLTHGDWLCTDDAPYQQLRRQVRSPAWQAAFLARPLAERQAIARQMREQSQARHAAAVQAAAGSDYAHINEALARQWLLAARATHLIHGHTHQPADHSLGANPSGQPLRRTVLSDWHITAHTRRLQALRLNASGGQPTRITPATQSG